MRKILVFSGAGLSADSGIPTFRGTDGLWENHKVEDVAEHEAWFLNKELVLRFYAERYNNYKNCEPHEGHYAIAKLQDYFDVTNVTQNIDNLLEQAGCKNVTHIHGTIGQKKCEWHKDITVLDGDPKFICDYKTDMDTAIEVGDLCPKCGGQMRPDIVFFNECVHHNYEDIIEQAKEIKYNNGIFICVGTSVQVYPAGYYIPLFSQVKNKYIVDINPRKIADYVLIKGTAKEQLPILVDKLISECD